MHLQSRSRVLYVLLFSTIFVVGLTFAFLYVFPSFSINGINSANNASALTYSSDTDISFTFNPTLSISLSDTNINIDNLLPGLSSESSPITVHVNSNTPYGYSLFASVGNSTDYNTTSLTHEDSNIGNNAVFTSIATNASLPELNTDNTWGYSLSSDNGTTWSNYNGLPLYSTVDNNTSTNNPALLIDTKSPADSTESIDFKIAAKASTTQASGTYNNVINFYAVGKPQVFYMQDTASIKTKLTNTNDATRAIDIRDGKEYWITKLMDGNIWMTQNLDFDIDSTKTYTPVDTDIPTNWTPIRSTTTNATWDDSIAGNITPHSYDPGNLYWDGVVTAVGDSNVSSNIGTYGGLHYHMGNFYNWTAAVAMNDSSLYTARYYDVNQSICPAGWRLPSYDGDKSYGDLITAQNLTSGTGGNIQNTPTYFVYGGAWMGDLNAVGFFGGYWYSVVRNSYNASYFNFKTFSDPFSKDFTARYSGFSLRCVMR